MKVKTITFFPNGNVVVFDHTGRQVPKLQKLGWFRLWVKAAKKAGLENIGKAKITMPDGGRAIWLEDIDNWTIE